MVDPTVGQTDLVQPNAESRYRVTRADLPLSCPMPGTLYRGREEVRAVLEKMAGGNAGTDEPSAPAPPPEMYFFANRALVYWNLMLPGADGSPQPVDGVDIIEFTDDGRIAVKDAYRKSFS